MNLTISGHTDQYAVEQLMLALFPESTPGQVLSTLERQGDTLTVTTKVSAYGKENTDSASMTSAAESVRLRRQLLQQSLYRAALPLLPSVPAWGALAGVRPTKITTKHLLQGGTAESADRLMEQTYFVTPDRRKLAIACSQSTVKAVSLLEPEDISLYIGIPFCPTRCAYCSFVSRTIGKKTELLEPYLDALMREIAVTGQLLRESGKHIRTIYIGGGTPSTLTSDQLARLMDGIREHFDLSRCLEFTVEGGRPDTLDAEKLRTIFNHGADRMSINPQSMIDGVLRASGRPHKAEDILRSYRDAVDAGFTAINMDLIAGLPTDTVAGFRESLDRVAALNPSNITVHTLALKKGADLFERREQLPTPEEVTEMVAYANKTLQNLGYKPYYLYRQKYMSGSYENVGWSRDGMDCLYNIYMMEEIHTILSLGGGGMNKVNLPDGKLVRFHNPKFPEQYIEMLPSVLDQKKELFALL